MRNRGPRVGGPPTGAALVARRLLPRPARTIVRHVLAEVGERDPLKIAKSAMGMLREYEQILRSKARTASVPVRSA